MGDGIDYLNEVRMRGRVAAAPEVKELPSGDQLVTMRVVVGRTDARRDGPARSKDGAGSTRSKDGAGSARSRDGTASGRSKDEAVAVRTVVDTIDVACWSASARRAAGRFAAGDVVEVEGALRRRFFRTGAGAASRYEVEARSLRRASAPTRASAPRSSTSP